MMWLSSFIFGVAFGSFLNVVIYRLKNGGSVVFGRSSCPQCKAVLKWYDLVPVLSFIWLKGKCRYCGKKISLQYPIVEILSGFIWVLIFYKFALPTEALAKAGVLNIIYYIFILSALLVIAVYDFKWKIIPDKIIYPAIAIALVYNIFPLDKGGLWGVLLTAVAAFLFFFFIFYFSKGKAMGLGDAKLAVLIGLFLSPLLAIIAFISAFIIGALCGIILIVLKKRSLKSQIAFGPFLAFGATIAFFFSDFIFKLLNL